MRYPERDHEHNQRASNVIEHVGPLFHAADYRTRAQKGEATFTLPRNRREVRRNGAKSLKIKRA